MTAPGRTLLACWLTAVLTGTAVDHRHAAAAGHTHGSGWAALPGGPIPAGLPLAHRHFVLLGIELGAVPGDGGAADGVRSAAEVVASDDARTADPLPDLPAPASCPIAVQPAEPLVDRSGLAAPAPRCPLISLARTGVLRS